MRLHRLQLAILSLAMSSGCSSNLSREQAEKLIESEYDKPDDPGMNCAVRDVRKPRSSSLSFPLKDELHQKCLAQLERVGVVVAGECVDPGCSGGCCERAIKAGPKGKPIGGGIYVACGGFKVHGVKSITTEARNATVKFEREFIGDEELLAGLGDCNLWVPEKGRSEYAWEFIRDDEGKWHAKQ